MPQRPSLWTDIVDLLSATDDMLRLLYRSHAFEGRRHLPDSALMFAEYARTVGKIRVSEQEARQALILNIQQRYRQFLFAVENPTNYRHNFQEDAASSGQSGRLDLTLYQRCESGPPRVLCNIELKSSLKLHRLAKTGQVNQAATHLRQDLFKLMVENVPGVFFDVSPPESGVKTVDVAIDSLREMFEHVENGLLDFHKEHPKLPVPGRHAPEILVYVALLDGNTREHSSRYFIMRRESGPDAPYQYTAPSPLWPLT